MSRRSAIPNPPSTIRWGSLRTKIIVWSFVPTTIILVAVALVTFYAYQRVTEELVIERDQELVRLAAGQLTDDLTEYTDLLTALTRTADIYKNDPSAQRAALKRASNRLAVFDGGVLILNTYGRIVAAEPERPEILGQDWSNRTTFRQMVRSQRPVFSDIVSDELQGAEVVVVAVPITGEQGEFTGMMAGMFRLGETTSSTFYRRIVKLHLEEGGSTYLVDGNGWVIYHSDAERIGDDFSAQPVVQQVLNRQVGANRTRDPDGRDIVAGFAPVPGTSWGLVTEENWATLISSSRGYQQFLLILLALGVMVPTLVVAVGVRRITRPITELIGAAQEVAGGNFGQTITASTGDEVEKLAEQFNLMSAQLQELYANLERRIADRTRELSALYDVTAVASESLDLKTTLERSLDRVLAVMGSETGAIHLLDETKKVLRLAAWRGILPSVIAQIESVPLGSGLTSWVIEHGEPLVVPETTTGPRPLRAIPVTGSRAYVGAPMQAKGRALGVLSVVAETGRQFKAEEVALLASIADQVALAVDNARLYEETHRRLAESQSLQQVTAALLQKLSLGEVLDIVCTEAQRLTGAMGSTVLLLDDEWLRAVRSTGVPIPNFDRMLVEGSLTGAAVRRGEPLMTNDAASDEQSYLGAPQPTALLAVPLCVKGIAIGALDVVDKVGGFTQDDVRIINLFADQAAIAIENARLYAQAQEAAVLKERERLARDLHDSVTQSLYSFTLFAEAGRRSVEAGELEHVEEYLTRLGETAQQALKEMRLLVYELRPSALEREGLVGAMQQRLDAVERRAGVEARLLVEGTLELPAPLEEGLYHIAQEALNNALKHAAATSVTVRIRVDGDCVELEVADNGKGFEPDTVDDKGGMGLISMRERAERLGGSLAIHSAPGEGTRVKVSVKRET